MAQEKKITVDQVAQALGISKTTVSRALSGKGRIGQETKERVFEYVRQNGGNPGEGKRPTFNLALVISSHFMQLDLPFLRKCMGGICRMAGQRGYDVLLCYADSRNAQQLERQLAAGKVDGVILTRALKQEPCIAPLRKYSIPYVVMGDPGDPNVLQVDNDQQAAAEEMTALLIKQGMNRIAYMGGSLSYTVNEQRLAGYTAAFRQARLAVNLKLVYSDLENTETQADALESVLEQRAECIICCDDNLALFVVRELQKRGIRVPEQIRVASLYDSEMLQVAKPSISAVAFDATALGVAACRLLLDDLAGKKVEGRILHGHQTVLRESTQM